MGDDLRMKGGKREGAGRKSGVNQKPMSFKIDLENVEILKNVINKNKFVNELIKQSTKSV